MSDHAWLLELPRQYFGCILADPPWQMKMWSEKGMGRSPDGRLSRNQSRQNNPARHYETMSLDTIKKMPVETVASPNCLLFMWTIDPMLPQAIEVGLAWGFAYKTIGFVWAKERRVTSRRGDAFDEADHKRFPMGTGYWTRANPEICLIFTRGAPKRLSASVRKLLIAPRREHSRKPDEQYDRIEQLVAGPYLELFARTKRPGWTVWGDQTDKFNAEAA